MLFAVSTIVTIVSCASMEAMGAMPMAGGWLLSGIWLPLCGQSWLETAVCFLGMWPVMMVAMMLPSLAPALWRYRNAAFAAGASRPGWFAVVVGAGYFAVWTGFGLLVFLLGAGLSQIAMQFPWFAGLGPVAGALLVLAAGLMQFSEWKDRQLRHCGEPLVAMSVRPGTAGAFRAGTVLGLRCGLSCAGPMATLIVGGLMDLQLMLCVTLVVTAERMLPAELRVAQATGAVMAAAGLLSLAMVLA